MVATSCSPLRGLGPLCQQPKPHSGHTQGRASMQAARTHMILCGYRQDHLSSKCPDIVCTGHCLLYTCHCGSLPGWQTHTIRWWPLCKVVGSSLTPSSGTSDRVGGDCACTTLCCSSAGLGHDDHHGHTCMARQVTVRLCTAKSLLHTSIWDPMGLGTDEPLCAAHPVCCRRPCSQQESCHPAAR